jgi:o-succinylbenzoate synthase
MRDRVSWIIKIWDTSHPEVYGLGECAPLPGLSKELTPDFEDKLGGFLVKFNEANTNLPESSFLSDISNLFLKTFNEEIFQYSSIVFAIETALLDLINGGEKVIFKNSFIEGRPIPINGLIWMGGLDFMLQQIEIKIRDGFKCIKLKVGGIDFEKECDVLQYIRRKYFREDITIRLDANGAFRPSDALQKLEVLSKFDIHSIEQPLKPNNAELAELCKNSPIPIALDEELIGVNKSTEKIDLLNRINPQFIILKPSFHGGLNSCAEWIGFAEERGIGWWITSALESNIGLNAIAQFTAQYDVKISQGLGTGMIYTNNFNSPLLIEKDSLKYDKSLLWEINY